MDVSYVGYGFNSFIFGILLIIICMRKREKNYLGDDDSI